MIRPFFCPCTALRGRSVRIAEVIPSSQSASPNRYALGNLIVMLYNPLQLRFEPSPLASYDRSARTIALIKDSGAEGFAFIGNAQHKDFGR